MDYRMEIDDSRFISELPAFLEEMLHRDPSAETRAHELYLVYCKWALAYGYRRFGYEPSYADFRCTMERWGYNEGYKPEPRGQQSIWYPGYQLLKAYLYLS